MKKKQEIVIVRVDKQQVESQKERTKHWSRIWKNISSSQFTDKKLKICTFLFSITLQDTQESGLNIHE